MIRHRSLSTSAYTLLQQLTIAKLDVGKPWEIIMNQLEYSSTQKCN